MAGIPPDERPPFRFEPEGVRHHGPTGTPVDGPGRGSAPDAPSPFDRDGSRDDDRADDDRADDDRAGDGGAAEPGDEPDQPGVELAPQQLVHRFAEPPGPPPRTGIFVEVPALRQYVGDLLRAYLGGYQVDAWGNMTFTYEGARIFVTVGMSPVGPQVGVFSITNLDVELSDELAAFLLAVNHDLGFGAYSYDRDNRAVWLRHALLGTTLDAPELQTAVAAIASTAAHFDDHIKERFGGRTFHEAPPEVQQAAHPPAPNASGYL